MTKKMFALSAICVALGALQACGGGGGSTPSDPPPTQPDPLANAPENVLMTWFGITNWHYQIGDMGVMLDGEVVNGARNAARVTKALETLTAQGTGRSIDLVLLGHVHPDHSNQIPEWARQTGKMVYGPPAICTTLVNTHGLPPEQCVGLKGGEVIKLSDFASVRAVRWVHSVGCDEYSNGTGGPETFGFLFDVKAKSGDHLSWFVSDSGAGGPDLTTPRVVTTSVNGTPTTTTYGSPIENLRAAMNEAGLKRMDVWQGGPESRMVYQARTVVPVFDVGYFMPHHLNSRSAGGQSFNLEYGMHYGYSEDDQPKLKQFLSQVAVPQVYPTNYFDAWVYDKDGLTVVGNKQMKDAYGLPETGPGPGAQFPNPRAGDLECVYD